MRWDPRGDREDGKTYLLRSEKHRRRSVAHIHTARREREGEKKEGKKEAEKELTALFSNMDVIRSRSCTLTLVTVLKRCCAEEKNKLSTLSVLFCSFVPSCCNSVRIGEGRMDRKGSFMLESARPARMERSIDRVCFLGGKKNKINKTTMKKKSWEISFALFFFPVFDLPAQQDV